MFLKNFLMRGVEMWIEDDDIDIAEAVFQALALLDSATLYSKNEVLKIFEENEKNEDINDLLLEKAVYPNGEKLGFYNTSEYTLKEIFKNDLSEEVFTEYLNSFSIEIQELFSIFELDFNMIKKFDYLENYLNISEKITENSKNIQKDFIRRVYVFSEYFNYKDYSNFLSNVLFDKVLFKDNISILHINPDDYFIFDALEYILTQNPNCDVSLYVVANSNMVAFPLKFLSIINKINFEYIVGEKYSLDYKDLFDYNNNFDFVIQQDIADELWAVHVPRKKLLSNYNINVSSREVYFIPFGDTFIPKEWLEKDLLESFIIIPVKLDRSSMLKETSFQLKTLVVLNHEKPIERKNKFIIIDMNKNKNLTTRDITLENYISFINNLNLYKNSYLQFSKFDESKFSIIFSNEDFIDKRIFNIGGLITNAVRLDINDLLYDIKMESQKNYFKIDRVDGEHVITEKLEYDVEELGNLVEREPTRFINGEFVDSQNHLYLSPYPSNGKWVYFDHEITNHRLFIKTKLISNKISLEYLYHYLNSQIGINEYDYVHRIPTYMRTFYEKIRVAIPPKEIQEKIVEAMNKSEELFEGMEQLKTTINKNFFNFEGNLDAVDEFFGKRDYSSVTQDIDVPENWAYTYSGLIWPLAVTYLIASGGYSKTEKYNNLIRLLEFAVAFNSYVLMSGLPEEIYEEEKSNIWSLAYTNPNMKDKLKNKLPLGFGNWTFFHGTLSGIYKKEFNTKINKDFYRGLLHKDIRKTYNNLADERNDYFHGSIKNEEECSTLLNQLNPTKKYIFNHLTACYKNYRLYYVAKKPELYSVDDGVMTFEYTMMYLNGPYSMPIYQNLLSEEILEIETLYLHDVIEDKFTKIDDRLIKFEAKDDNKHDWRLYVFIGFEKINGERKAKYRCYQRWEEDLFKDINLNELM